MQPANTNEQMAALAFSGQALIFDQIYGEDTIIRYKRRRVRSHFLSHANPGGHILELNSGTGEDATYFARNGFKVHATDIAEGMQNQLKIKAASLIGQGQLSTELCSFTQLDSLNNQGPYDAIFSNFGGLNCTGELNDVLRSFDSLLKPGGVATLVIIPPFCLWETLLMLRGKFRTAARRWFASNGRQAKIDGNYFTCWYYTPRYVKKHMPKSFEVIDLEGLCTIVPPSYIAGFAEKHPAVYMRLVRLEDRFKRVFPFRYWGDYFVITIRKKN